MMNIKLTSYILTQYYLSDESNIIYYTSYVLHTHVKIIKCSLESLRKEKSRRHT